VLPGRGGPWPAPAAAPAATEALPTELAQDLLRLARLGHAQGLQRHLDALLAEHPALAARVAELRELASRCAWPELIASLARELDLADGETTT
jgi:hypothetical protein